MQKIFLPIIRLSWLFQQLLHDKFRRLVEKIAEELNSANKIPFEVRRKLVIINSKPLSSGNIFSHFLPLSNNSLSSDYKVDLVYFDPQLEVVFSLQTTLLWWIQLQISLTERSLIKFAD